MSASSILIRFKKTGNIYMGCHEGTSDVTNPYICTAEECYDEKLDCYCSITYCRELAKGKSYAFPKDVQDLDEVEVYSDWNFSGYFKAVGSESLKMISCPLDEFGELDYNVVIREKPDWVTGFWEELDV